MIRNIVDFKIDLRFVFDHEHLCFCASFAIKGVGVVSSFSSGIESRLSFKSVLWGSASALLLLATPAAADEANNVDGKENIVVTAAGFAQRIEEAPASISVLSREELMETRYQSLAEALANVEGVDVGASAGKTGGLNISIRGMPSDYTLVLIDGRRQNSAGSITPNGFGETSTSFMPPMSSIERIEVVRGPVSTLYGSDAMGGVVNIITRKVGDTWSGSGSANVTLQENQDFGEIYGGTAYVQGPIVSQLLGLALRGSYSERAASKLNYERADGSTAIVSARGPSPVKNRLWSLGGRLNITPHHDHDLYVDASVNRQWYDNSTGQLGNLGSSGYSTAQQFNQEEYVLAHTWRLPFGEMQNTLSRNTRETLGRELPSDVPGGGSAGDPRTLEATNTIFDSKLSANVANHNFTVGGQYWHAKMVDGVAPAPYKHEQWALFIEDEWRLVENFAITGGVRYDNHSVFGNHFSPRGYAVWNVNDNWTVKGGVSQGFKTPRLDQIAPGITGFTGQGTRPTIGTPTLKPETSTSMEASIFFDNRSSFRANVGLFHNKFKDKIATGAPLANCSFNQSQQDYENGDKPSDTCADYGYWPTVETFSQTVNIDEATTKGAEAGFRWIIVDGLSLTGNYTYTDTKAVAVNTGAVGKLYDTPRHMVNGALRWTVSDTVNLWLRGEYRSSRYRDEDSATSRAKATHGNYKPYSIIHVGGALKVNESFTFNAAIYNLLNKDFVSYAPYISNTDNNTISYTNLYANNQEPRRLWLSANLDF